MKTMLDPRIVAASTHAPLLVCAGGSAALRITPSSQGKFAMSQPRRETDPTHAKLAQFFPGQSHRLIAIP
jgi:hypothetical protein